ncbi:hypothetical protein Droror1_Dr00022584, partial [Drosera rotundifolia]
MLGMMISCCSVSCANLFLGPCTVASPCTAASCPAHSEECYSMLGKGFQCPTIDFSDENTTARPPSSMPGPRNHCPAPALPGKPSIVRRPMRGPVRRKESVVVERCGGD